MLVFLRFIIVLLGLAPIIAQPASAYKITPDSLLERPGGFTVGARLYDNWSWSNEDSLSFSHRDYLDLHWKKIPSAFRQKDVKKYNIGKGVIWLRFRITLDAALKNKILAIGLEHGGASEVYLNGILYQKNGRVSSDPDQEVNYNPKRIPLSYYTGNDSLLVIAVRYSRAHLERYSSFLPSSPFLHGFQLYYGEAQTYHVQTSKLVNLFYPTQLILMGIMMALAMAHLIVALYYRADKANRKYAMFAGMLAITFLGGYFNMVTHSFEVSFVSVFVQMIGLSLLFRYFVALMYTICFGEERRYHVLYFWISILIGVLFFIIDPSYVIYLLIVYIIVTLADGSSALIRTYKKRKNDLKIILRGAIGFAFLIVLSFISNIFPSAAVPEALRLLLLYIGFLSIPLSMSIYLARSFATANFNLEKKIIEINELNSRTLEQERKQSLLLIENERKSAELEGARKMQLSMLPSVVPNIPGFDIAFSMQTASEVGGDFYDYKIISPGNFTFVVGDATGHGVRAGIMVAAAKTIFSTHTEIKTIPNFFEFCTQSLKKLNFGTLYLSLSVIHFKENTFRFACAGMPPVLHFSAEGKTTHTLHSKGMPLGKFDNFPYSEIHGTMAPGDVIVLMSDGLMECFNESKTLLGLQQIIDSLNQHAHLSANEILAHFSALAYSWSNSPVPNDDISLVILKKQ